MFAQTESPVSEMDTVLSHFPAAPMPWPGARWTWDVRFSCAISVLRVDEWAKVEAWLAQVLPLRFESVDAGHLTPRQRAAVQRFGGVRSGQLGLADIDRAGPQRFALAWPWSDGVHVSIRLAVA